MRPSIIARWLKKKFGKTSLLQNPEKLRDYAAKIVKKNINKEIDKAGFKKKPSNIKRAVTVVKTNKGIKIIVTAKAMAHDKGVRKHQMRHLLKSKRPIPLIDKATGKKIFRNASKRSMQQKKWIHPGWKPKSFIKKGVKKSNIIFKDKIGKTVAMVLNKYLYFKE